MANIYVTARNGMGAITETGGNFVTTGMEENDIMHADNDLFLNPGVVDLADGGLAVSQNGSPDKSVNVAKGIALVDNSSYSRADGVNTRYWRVELDGTENVAIPDNVAGNPRIDIICVKVDTTADANDDASNVATVVCVTGTAAASPSAPAIPNDHLKLAQVAVANGFTTITTGDITDFRIAPSVNPNDGWIAANETWTRTGDHIFTVSGDKTTKYRKGTKVRYVDSDGSNKYGIVASSPYGAPNTTVTLITNTNYTMAASTIRQNYISYIENPVGFPPYLNYTPSFGGFSSAPTVIGRFSVKNGMVMLSIRTTAAGTSNANSFTVTAPVSSNNVNASMSWFAPAIATDNGSVISTSWSRANINNNTSTINLYPNPSSSSTWTTSGNKFADFTLLYEM